MARFTEPLHVKIMFWCVAVVVVCDRFTLRPAFLAKFRSQKTTHFDIIACMFLCFGTFGVCCAIVISNPSKAGFSFCSIIIPPMIFPTLFGTLVFLQTTCTAYTARGTCHPLSSIYATTTFTPRIIPRCCCPISVKLFERFTTFALPANFCHGINPIPRL